MSKALSQVELDRRRRLPQRRVPLLYYLFAYLSLTSAFALIAADPAAIAGFYYHPRMIAVVHLVTLGWISCSILGTLYLIGPLTLGMALPHRRLDDVILALVAIGTLGMVSHFWIDEPSGMAWSAGTVLAGLALAAWRLPPAAAHSRLPWGVRLHLRLAFLNLLLAAALGFVVGLDKNLHFLPGNALDRVYAHAHLAAIGWGVMIVMGAGYRLLPMFLPAAPPRGWRAGASAVLLEVGVLGLVAGFVFDSPPARGLFALIAAAGVAAFLLQVRWMLANRRPPAAGVPRPDFAVLQAQLALACLAATVLIGLALALGPPALWKPAGIMVYGTLGLVGFLAQMVVGIGARIFPLAAWTWSSLDRKPGDLSPALHGLFSPRLRASVVLLWAVGLPVLAIGLGGDFRPLVRLGALTLAAAVVGGGLELVVIYRRSRAGGAQGDEVYSSTKNTPPPGAPADPAGSPSRTESTR